jgi:5-methylcytosine-specific restriction endonuclease McrA
MNRMREMLGGKCVRCGATSDLEFDHVDRHTKSFTIGSRAMSRWDGLLVELAKCQLLCRPCHIEKTYN